MSGEQYEYKTGVTSGIETKMKSSERAEAANLFYKCG